MARPAFPLSPAAVEELIRLYRQPRPPSFRALAAHLRSRRLVTRRIDPRIVWRVIRARFPAKPIKPRRGAA